MRVLHSGWVSGQTQYGSIVSLWQLTTMGPYCTNFRQILNILLSFSDEPVSISYFLSSKFSHSISRVKNFKIINGDDQNDHNLSPTKLILIFYLGMYLRSDIPKSSSLCTNLKVSLVKVTLVKKCSQRCHPLSSPPSPTLRLVCYFKFIWFHPRYQTKPAWIPRLGYFWSCPRSNFN